MLAGAGFLCAGLVVPGLGCYVLCICFMSVVMGVIRCTGYLLFDSFSMLFDYYFICCLLFVWVCCLAGWFSFTLWVW